jgi:hypothetical protein
MMRFLKVIAVFGFGLAIGIGGTLYWTSSQDKALRSMAAMYILNDNGEEADYLYKNAPPQIAIYKLNRMLDKIASFQEGVYFNERQASWDNGLFHGRIGKLYREIGASKDASEHLNKSLQYFANFGWRLKDENELLRAIDMLDTMKISVVLKSIGEFKQKTK